MSKRQTAATLVGVAVLLTATAAVNSFARNARDFGRGYREGYRAVAAGAAAGAPLATASQPNARPFLAGYEHGRVEAARRVNAATAPAVANAPQHASTGGE